MPWKVQAVCSKCGAISSEFDTPSNVFPLPSGWIGQPVVGQDANAIYCPACASLVTPVAPSA